MITVLTLASEQYWSLMQLTAKNRSEYCKRHGYTLALHKTPCSHPPHHMIEKLQGTINLLQRCDYLLFMGVDTCFTNMTVKLESLIEKYGKPDIIVGEDVNGANDDVILYRNCPGVIDWLATILAQIHDFPSEQFLLNNSGISFSELNIKKIPQKEINAMPYWLYDYPNNKGGQWEQGDFIFHAPGLPLDKRLEVITEVLGKVVR